jgi:methylmalonyl-CoA/ethylmalonyl-CoA epimerase
VLKFHHVGVGTKNFEEAIQRYRALGHELLLRVDDPNINVRVAFVQAASSPLIEILAPLGPGGPLDSLIARKSIPGPYHTCYAVESMAAGSERLRETGLMPISAPMPAAAFAGSLVAFFYDRDIGLVELVERPPFIGLDRDREQLR